MCYDGSTVAVAAPASATVGGVDYNFVKWSTGETDLAINVLMDADKSVTAEYAIQTWTLTVDSSPAGAAVTGGGVSRETSSYQADPNIAEIEARLREIFRTKVRLVMNKDRGRIEIEFYTSDDFDRIINLLAGG